MSAPEKIWPTLSEAMGMTKPQAEWTQPNSCAGEYTRTDAIQNSAYLSAAQKCLELLDGLVGESGRGIEYGEEDAFRMGEWFDVHDIAAIEQFRAAISAIIGETK